MSKNELVAKIEALNEWEAVIEEAKAEAEAIRDSIKAEMLERDTEEMSAGKYIVRWTSVLSNRFDTTAFIIIGFQLWHTYLCVLVHTELIVCVYVEIVTGICLTENQIEHF